MRCHVTVTVTHLKLKAHNRHILIYTGTKAEQINHSVSTRVNKSEYIVIKCNGNCDKGYSIKEVSGRGDHTAKKILQVDGTENFVIPRVGGPENVVILWSDKNYNSAGGWSEKSSVVIPTSNFLNGIALSEKL